MIIYGKQLVLHLLEKRRKNIEVIYLAKELDKNLFSKVAKSGAKIVKVDNKKAQALAHGGNHQGFLAEIKDFEFADFEDLKNFQNLIMLYNLSDVGNIGAIVRSAYALGADGLIVVNKNIAMEGVIRTSAGAAFELPIVLLNDGLSAINELKQSGFSILAAAAGGQSPDKVEGKSVLVMGNEGDGIPNRVLSKCDKKLGIKMREGWDSLNVSVAFGILFDRIKNG